MSLNGWGNYQTTIRREIVLTGIGVHSGKPASLILHPAAANSGYNFYLNSGDRWAHIPGDFRAVNNVTLCTVIGDGKGANIATIEHLMAALRGIGIDNVDIEADCDEVPVMDGSAEPYVDAIDEVGIRELGELRRYIRVLKPVEVTGDKGETAMLMPYDGFKLDIEIDFDTAVIGRQRLVLDLTPYSFRREIARARTFGFMRDVKKLWACGRALGASLDNTVALGDDKVINPEGLRYENEFVRHKTLDAIGDLALAGAPLLAQFRSVRGGHKLNSMMLHALYANKDAWELVEGVRSKPRHREVAVHADMGMAMPQMAFAPVTD
jgi:UDP-3-O-[3-hydroxymyristoyl] N-acetylglucosamine deacetylase